MPNNHKISTQRLTSKVSKFFDDIEREHIAQRNFPKAYELAEFFRKEVKSRQRYLNASQWAKSKEAAIEFISNIDYIKIEDLKLAIVWFLDNKHHNVSVWWQRLKIQHLGTVINNYNLWLDHHKEEDKPGRKRYFKYG